MVVKTQTTQFINPTIPLKPVFHFNRIVTKHTLFHDFVDTQADRTNAINIKQYAMLRHDVLYWMTIEDVPC